MDVEAMAVCPAVASESVGRTCAVHVCPGPSKFEGTLVSFVNEPSRKPFRYQVISISTASSSSSAVVITRFSGPSAVTFEERAKSAVGALLSIDTFAERGVVLMSLPSPAFTITVQISPFKVEEAGNVVKPVSEDFLIPFRHHVISESDSSSPSISDMVNATAMSSVV